MEKNISIPEVELPFMLSSFVSFLTLLFLNFQTTLEASVTELQTALVSLTMEILAAQASLTLLTGETLNLSTLTVNLIDLSQAAIVETAPSVTVSQPSSVSEKVYPTNCCPLSLVEVGTNQSTVSRDLNQ